ncbi:MAG: M48 family metallopeptidase [Candidatus Electrothrix sp. GW3-4]|uniref:M48 family metallopeptidase n=1 Tax=Candidatus Electrothrix sp. GW3-4 TaxID=3126740 RepID=UPI0030D21E31
MLMTDEQYAALVSESDELARTRPDRYLRKMRCLLWLGDLYLVVITVLLLTLQVGALCIIIRDLYTGAVGWQTVLSIPVLIWASWLMYKLVLMKGGRKASSGIPLTREQAPELFTLIDTLSSQADAQPLHRVLITDIFHASLEQLPRLGIFGWYHNTLLLGLPLFKCLTIEQFKALLAHELGHLANKGCCKTARRGHRQMLRWTGLADTLGDSPNTLFFKHFLEWFMEYVGAYAGPLVRMSEYEADTLSVRLVSHEAAVETLCISNVIDRYLETYYWPQVRQQANELPEPVAPYQMMAGRFTAQVTMDWAEHWVAVDMRTKTDPKVTHPALQDRLKALQATPHIVLAEAGQNAEGLLGNAFQTITEQMDREWQAKNRSWWVERYQRVQDNRQQFAELNTRVARGEELSVEEAYQRAQLTWSVDGNEEETLRQLLALYFQDKENPLASFGLGAWLLNRWYTPEDEYDAEDGYALLEQAMRLDESFTVRCCEMLRDYCQENDREKEAQKWDKKLQARLQLEEAAKQERSQM